jgi:hypothetical protein
MSEATTVRVRHLGKVLDVLSIRKRPGEPVSATEGALVDDFAAQAGLVLRYVVLRSTVPTHSSAAWPSFLTGVDPADHGVYDILETVPGTHNQYPVTYRSIKERTGEDPKR